MNLLGRDYDDGIDIGPAVTYGNKDDSVDYPQITFRKSGGSEPVDGHDFGIRADVVYDLEIWDNRRNAHTIDEINEQVEILLDASFQKTPVIALDNGRCFWSDSLGEISIMYDPDTNSWFGLRRYRFVEARI